MGINFRGFKEQKGYKNHERLSAKYYVLALASADFDLVRIPASKKPFNIALFDAIT